MRRTVVMASLFAMVACSRNTPSSTSPSSGDTTPIVPTAGVNPPDVTPQARYALVCGRSGIQRLTFDPATATLTLVDTQVGTLQNPSFLAFAPGKKVIYVAEEDGKKIHAYAFTSDAKLTELGTPKDSGGGPPYVGTDTSGAYVFAANFNEGTARVFSTNADGSLGEPLQTVSLGKGAHQMPVHPEKPVVYVPCRDDEHIYQFDFADGTLSNQRSVAIADNAGPRHLVFHPSLPYAYLINEFAGMVIKFAVNGDGSLGAASTPVSLLQTAASGDKSGAEIAFAPSGTFLYASVRGSSNIIATLSVDAHDGSLVLIANDSAHGTKPRHFSLDSTGQWMFVANEITNDVSVFAVNTATGALTYKSTVGVGRDPQMVTLLP